MNRFWKWTKRIVTGLLILLLISGALTYAAGGVAKSNLLRANPAPGQLVDVGGFKMHIPCTGEGSPTVILISGLDDFSIVWSRVQPEIARTTHVCSYDRAGLGWSEFAPGPRTSRGMVKELHGLLVNAGVEGPYVIAGHSFGGALAELYIHTYPDEILGLVLVDSAPTNLFNRVPVWSRAIEQKLGFYRTLAPLSSFGLLAFAPNKIPNRGFPDDALAQYRAISVATDYYQAGIAENELFASNLAEVGSANIAFGDLPLIVLSRGRWDAMPGLTEEENAQARQAWSDMQAELLKLSRISKQIIAEASEHSIQLDQSDLVIEAILELVHTSR
ncbi:MAG TPA: alpha/beta hydrolase [Anaerolineales bacterium]